MPYTPPSHRSPATSAPGSPDLSRRSSFQSQTGTSRPALPHSASYLTKHRRTPAAATIPNGGQPTPQTTGEDLAGMVAANSSSSVRKSPPPVTDDRMMPNCAILSPPESSSSEDEGMPEIRGRRIENLKELHDAISQIPQHRASSPSKAGPAKTDNARDAPDAGDILILPSQAAVVSEVMHHSFSTSALDELAVGRRISHTRSATEPGLMHTKSASNSVTCSDEDSDDELRRKPQMVRKKSGELVRPALRPASRRRPSSMPGTPTFSKAVHFDSHLEHVRHFLQVDRPLAVSAGSSPIDNYDSDAEYPFSSDDKVAVKTPPYEWDIIMSNFPLETPARKALPVRLERVWLSSDQKSLIGAVVVANLAFQKYVTCRFTLDYWKTTSEVAAEFVCEVQPKESPQGHDRFTFTIKLADMANLESKTLYFCIRYNVNGQELWDNNSGTNFQVDFSKKMLLQNGKRGPIGAANRSANGLPRSNRRQTGSSSMLRPKSVSSGLDGFGASKIDMDQSIHDYLGEGPTPLRLKSPRKPGANMASDNLSGRLTAPSGQAFANRYDFGASLTAAVQAAKDSTKSDGLYMKPGRKSAAAAPAPKPARGGLRISAPPKPVLPDRTVAGNDSPGASIASSSYEELVNKYCFFGSKPASPQVKDGAARAGRFDGGDDMRNGSLTGSPLQLGETARSTTQAALSPGAYSPTAISPTSFAPKDPNPYFQQATALMRTEPSPAESPLNGLPHERTSSSPPTNHTRTSPKPVASLTRSPSPAAAAVVGSFGPFAGTSPNDFQYPRLHDRFPFSGADAHPATAIRG